MWVEADTNLSGGESLTRQILYGRQYFQNVLGIDSRILGLPDVFGYSDAQPQILVGCGMQGFAAQKITWAYNGGNTFPYNTFLWEGVDGTAIPAHSFTDYNAEVRPSSVLDRWNTRLKKNGINSMIFAFGGGTVFRLWNSILSCSSEIIIFWKVKPCPSSLSTTGKIHSL